MKKYLKKIMPFFCVVLSLVVVFSFSVGASSSVSSRDDHTLAFTKMHRSVMYSTSAPFGVPYDNLTIPMENNISSFGKSTWNTFLDFCDSNYFYMRMFPTTSDFKITVPAGGTFEGGVNFVMYALTGDTSTGNPPTQFSGSIPVAPNYTEAGNVYVRARLVNASGSVEYFLDYTCVQNPNNAYVTWSKISWRNISGEDLYVDYFEFGCTPSYDYPIFFYHSRCIELPYRVYSPDETATGDISNSIKSSAEETQKIVKESHEEMVEEVRKNTGKVVESIEETADKITNGWTPKPEKPPGSDKIEDYVEQDEELKNEIQGGIDKGNEIIDSLSSNLLEYGAGFAFIILLFDRLNFSWLNTLMNISLTLGVSAFLLNIAPSLTRGIGRLSSKGGKGKKGG